MPAYSDSALRPELVERSVRVEEETTITNRLYALTDFLKQRPIFPQLTSGETDVTCFQAWRSAWLHANNAVAEIAQSTVGWAGEHRGTGPEPPRLVGRYDDDD